MRKINTNEIHEDNWSSPGGKFVGAGKGISEALGRDPSSTDSRQRHPFDAEITRIPRGRPPTPITRTVRSGNFIMSSPVAGLSETKTEPRRSKRETLFFFNRTSHTVSLTTARRI